MNERPPEVRDRDSAVKFVIWCVQQLGLAYHPDTQFAEYVNREGTAAFSPVGAEQLDKLSEKSFFFCDPYEVGSEQFDRLIRQGQGEGSETSVLGDECS